MLLAASWLLAAPAWAVSHVFLVQNSGWMEPFYTDPNSQFKPLVAAVANAAVAPGDALVLAAFNQSLPDAPSPRALLARRADGDTGRAVRAALQPLEPARKPGSKAYADTDLSEAVGSAVRTALHGRPGLVWVFTNNRNSPNNDQATARRNREFYQLIHQGGDIRMALAYPLRMPVQGGVYKANGLMVYVFAVGEEGARDLKALLASGRIGKVITEPAARLKPLDRDTVRLLPVRVSEAPGVGFSMAPNGALLADVDSDARSPAARIDWQLENTIYPYTIAAARVTARSLLAREDRPVVLAKDQVARLAPGSAVPLSSTMQLPVAQLPSVWSLQAFKSAGSAYILPGSIQVQLTGQRLELSQAFRTRMEELFPGDPLPDIFTPPADIHGSTAVLPLQVRVHFGMAPLAILAGGALALLAAGGGALYAYNRPRQVVLNVDGERRTVRTRAGSVQPVYDRSGAVAAQLKTTLFGHQLVDLREGAQVSLQT
ncbi:hypothetical protein E4L96_18105 [Massilia arenosa]|uniref:VWA domain-containing protein n=1 Tax=Zemynaea arenosa TaxID=2561931 RepID=A0A4Y9S630_9BURK|nr:hypothetical protein E4L96_18105 [Massilia arenosa]